MKKALRSDINPTWDPGIDNDDKTINEVLVSLPGDDPVDIPWQVRIFENPASPFALPGAVTLQRHDPLHVILGRGISLSDECFVVGYTMGTAISLRNWHIVVFKWFVNRYNPLKFRPSKREWQVFDQGLLLGRQMGVRNVHLISLEEWGEMSVAEARVRLGINKQALHALSNFTKCVLFE